MRAPTIHEHKDLRISISNAACEGASSLSGRLDFQPRDSALTSNCATSRAPNITIDGCLMFDAWCSMLDVGCLVLDA